MRTLWLKDQRQAARIYHSTNGFSERRSTCTLNLWYVVQDRTRLAVGGRLPVTGRYDEGVAIQSVMQRNLFGQAVEDCRDRLVSRIDADHSLQAWVNVHIHLGVARKRIQ